MPRFVRNLALHVSYVVAALLLLGIFLHDPGINPYYRARLTEMVAGTAWRPYVTRALLPQTAHLLVWLLPHSAHDAIVAAGRDDPWKSVLRFSETLPAQQLPELLVTSLLMFGSALGALYAMRAFARSVYEPHKLADWAPLLLALVLPCTFRYCNYIYDFSQLMLFTLALALMAKRNWRAFLPVFALAAANKETSVLLIPLCAWQLWPIPRDGRIRAATLLGAQVALFALIRGGIGFAFRHNQGAATEFHLWDHNVELLRPYQPDTALVIVALVVLVAHDWQAKPLIVRRALSVLIPLVGATLFLGLIDELRDYDEALPAFVLLAGHTLAKLVGSAPVALPGFTARDVESAKLAL